MITTTIKSLNNQNDILSQLDTAREGLRRAKTLAERIFFNDRIRELKDKLLLMGYSAKQFEVLP